MKNIVFLLCLFYYFYFSISCKAQYVYERQIGAKGLAQFTGPAGLTLDDQGNIYVADQHLNCVYKVSSSGQLLLKFGLYGTSDGQLDEPFGIALDGQGNIYVTENFNHRVQIFNASGQFLLKIGTQGTGKGQFSYPKGVLVDPQGNIYVADKNNHRIQKFNSKGEWLSMFGSYGIGNGQFNSPGSLALDKQGNLYVADYNYIHKFDANGQFIIKFGSQGTGDGQFKYPSDIKVDADGHIYLVDTDNNRILKFAASGSFLFSFGSLGKEAGQFDEPNGIALDRKGNIYVADQWNHRVQKFSITGTFLSALGTEGKEDGQFIAPQDVTLDTQKNLYVADRDNHRIQKFTAQGEFIFAFGSAGQAQGQLKYPTNVVIDSQGNIYVADSGNHRIQKFNGQGKFLTQWGNYGSADGQFNNPGGMEFDKEGNLYVADQNNHRIQKFSSSGTFLSKFGTKGALKGQFTYPCDLTLDSQGNLYVVDLSNHRIQKFTANGVFHSIFGTRGSADGQFYEPLGITIDSEDHIYVADAGNHRIQQFNINGDFISKFGTYGSGNGQLHVPMGLTIDAQGSIYVADVFNHRIQKFSLSPQILLKAGDMPIANNTSFDVGHTAYLTPFTTHLIIDNTAGRGTLFVADFFLPAGFILSEAFPASIAAGTTASFSIQLEAGEVGIYAGFLSFTTNDPSNKLYQIAIRGEVTKADQRITLTNLPDKIYGDAPFEVIGSASSGLPLSFSVETGSATLEGNTVRLTGAGQVNILITQSGNNQYHAAEERKSFMVKKAHQTIPFLPLLATTYKDSSFNLPENTSASLLVTYSSSNEAVATIDGNRVRIVGAGKTTLSAIQTGNNNYNSAEAVSQSLVVNKASQSIHIDAILDQSLSDTTLSIMAEASSTLPVSLTVVSGPATVLADKLTLTGVGEVVIKAEQLGNENYLPAEAVTQRFCILPVSPVISAANNSLSSSCNFGNQWYVDGQVIEGATEQVLLTNKEGSYQVSVSGPCGQAVLSEPFLVKLSAIDENVLNLIQLYPNPAREQVIVELKGSLIIERVQMMTLQGLVVADQEVNRLGIVIFSVHNLSAGIYFFEVYTSKGVVRKKFSKQ
jgi:sugar lactone lactonase YvrE/uncharacterized protein YhhL (DUF1145 family)